tara:strand:+ start:114 stop:683 length:570 start_codon:yes stop_codon:yes gene_type:complete
MKNKILDLLKDSGAFLEGHFLLTSGKHSNIYIEKFRLMESPKHLEVICKMMSSQFNQNKVDIVLGAAIGGILLSSGVAKYLNKKSIFTERIKEKMELRRGFEIKENSRVLIVEDIVSTGGSIFELIDVVKNNKANVVGVASIVHRSLEEIDFGCDYKPLLHHPVESWYEKDVPGWLSKIPITVHGRSGK